MSHFYERLLLIESSKHVLSSNSCESFAETIVPDLDWQYIVSKSARHGIAPLLFRTIDECGLARHVPQQVFADLQKIYLASLMKNKQLLDSLEPVLKSFADASVATILMKGAALCQNVYSDIALRPMGDIDILVPKDSVDQCSKLLEQIGYSRMLGVYRAPDEKNFDMGCEWTYLRDGFVMELHWNLVDKLTPFEIDIATYWKDPQVIEISGQPALLMNPEALLQNLCLHQFKHQWRYMRDILDIALVVEKFSDNIDWDGFVKSAKNQGIELCVYHSLVLANDLLGVSLKAVPLSQLLGREKPSRLARSTTGLISDNIFTGHMPRRFWNLILVKGNIKRFKLLRQILSHPLARHDMHEVGPAEQPVAFRSRVTAGLKSIVYYRRLLLELFRNYLRGLRKPDR